MLCDYFSSIVKVAAKSGVSIVPVAYGAKRKKVFNSWDKFILPSPFNQLKFVYGEPVKVSSDISDKQVEKINQELKEKLKEICEG